MFNIEFEYKDKYSHGKWNRQSCTVSSVEECKRIYGLGIDCEYRILSVNAITDDETEKKNKTFQIGDIVMVQGTKQLEPIKCKIVNMGPDENGVIWYSCDPIEFSAFPREFRADCLSKVQE